MRKKTTPAPTEEEILQHDNVPADLAARFIGWSTPTLYFALQQERAPFGMAVQNQTTGTWTYNISPGALVRYKRGELPTYKLKEVIDLAAEGVEQVISRKMSAISLMAKTLGGVS